MIISNYLAFYKYLPNRKLTIDLDGCSYYWRVKVDLKMKKLFDLEINGVG